jgi:invasion protein IalB
MFLDDSAAEAKAISLMKAGKNVTLDASDQGGHKYKFTSSLSDFSEAVRLITQACK